MTATRLPITDVERRRRATVEGSAAIADAATRQRRVTPEDKITTIGQAGGYRFVRLPGMPDEAEYILGEFSASEAAKLRPGDYLVERPVLFTDDRGKSIPTGRLHAKAELVPTGTYAALAAQDAEREALTARRQAPRPIDSLRRLPALASRPPLSLAGTDDSASLAEIILEAQVGTPRPSGWADGRERITGAAAILAWAQSKAELSIAPSGRLLVRPRGGRLAPQHRDAIHAAARLLTGLLTGVPVLCELSHPAGPVVADTIIDIDIAACREHADGSIAP